MNEELCEFVRLDKQQHGVEWQTGSFGHYSEAFGSATDGCYDSRKVGEYTTSTIFLARTMEYLSAFPIICYRLPFCLFRHCRCSKLARVCINRVELWDTGAPSLHYLRHLLAIHQLLSLSLSVTFAFLAPSQYPIQQADLTAFALRRVAVAHE